jgi:hypothetical protein
MKQQPIERTPSCFDVIAGVWVYMYERNVPQAQKEAQQNLLLDDLQASTTKLKLRRTDIHVRMKQYMQEARVLNAKKDTKAFKNKMFHIKRLRAQVDRIDTSISTIEANIDEIINSDVTKEILDSLRKSTEAMKLQCFPLDNIQVYIYIYLSLSLSLSFIYDTSFLYTHRKPWTICSRSSQTPKKSQTQSTRASSYSMHRKKISHRNWMIYSSKRSPTKWKRKRIIISRLCHKLIQNLLPSDLESSYHPHSWPHKKERGSIILFFQ